MLPGLPACILNVIISKSVYWSFLDSACSSACTHTRDKHPVLWRLAGSFLRPREHFMEKSGLACLSWCVRLGGGQFAKLASAHKANSTVFL